jgi:hypothetical protein
MPQVCTVCKHPQRLEIERALLNRNTYRYIAKHFGTSTTALIRHRDHIAGALAQRNQTREVTRTRTLLQDVRAGEGRADRLYAHAEAILAAALKDQDRRSALQAIRAAVDVMAEARNLMQVRGELTGELQREATLAGLQIQIVCPSAPDPANLPRITFANFNAVDTIAEPLADCTEEIGLIQG